MTTTAGATTGAAMTPRIVANARPDHYPGTADWMVAGAGRYQEGIWVAAIVTWTGLPIALWIAVLGAVVGALLGLFGSSSTGLARDLHLSEGVGVVAAIIGALKGIVVGFLAIYLVYINHPQAFVGAVLSGLLIGAATLTILIAAEPKLMGLRGYRPLSRREKERLHPLLVQTGAKMGLTVVPELWMSDSQKPAAWTHPRAIVVTRGLLGDTDASERAPQSDLDDMALAAILAHELHHWAVGDAVGSRAVWACFWPVVAIYNAAAWLRMQSGWLGTLGWILFWPAWVTAKLIVIPVMSTASRRNEYAADWTAASLGADYRLGLRRALNELAVWEKPRTGWEDALAATHPAIELRLERLEDAMTPGGVAVPPPTVSPTWTAVTVTATRLPPIALTDTKVLAASHSAYRAYQTYYQAQQDGNDRSTQRAKAALDRETLAYLEAVKAGLEAAGHDRLAYFPLDRDMTINLNLPDVEVVISGPARAPASTTPPAIPAAVAPGPAPSKADRAAPSERRASRRRGARAASEQSVSSPAPRSTASRSKPAAPAERAVNPQLSDGDDGDAAARWGMPRDAPPSGAPKRPSSPAKKPPAK